MKAAGLVLSLCLMLLADGPVAAQSKPAPATVEEAAKVIDLRSFPSSPKAQGDVKKSIAWMNYNCSGNARETFEFIKNALAEKGWKDTLFPPMIGDEYSSASFVKDGFILAVNISGITLKEGKTYSVSLMNMGNVDASTLPPDGSWKKASVTRVGAIYNSEASVEETMKQAHAMLVKEGWEPHGLTGTMMNYKKHGVRVTVNAFKSNSTGKTSVNYGVRMMSFDLPVPLDCTRMLYSDIPAMVSFTKKCAMKEVFDFYQKELTGRGWKQVNAQPTKESIYSVLKYEHGEKGKLSIKAFDKNGETQVSIALEQAK